MNFNFRAERRILMGNMYLIAKSLSFSVETLLLLPSYYVLLTSYVP